MYSVHGPIPLTARCRIVTEPKPTRFTRDRLTLRTHPDNWELIRNPRPGGIQSATTGAACVQLSRADTCGRRTGVDVSTELRCPSTIAVEPTRGAHHRSMLCSMPCYMRLVDMRACPCGHQIPGRCPCVNRTQSSRAVQSLPCSRQPDRPAEDIAFSQSRLPDGGEWLWCGYACDGGISPEGPFGKGSVPFNPSCRVLRSG